MSATFWVIEKRLPGGEKHFFAMDIGEMTWSIYVEDAVRFCREQDASEILDMPFFEEGDTGVKEYEPCGQ